MDIEIKFLSKVVLYYFSSAVFGPGYYQKGSHANVSLYLELTQCLPV